MKHYAKNLYCFSPPVMIATFALELTLAMYVLWKFRSEAVSRLIFITLVCLGIFQLAEWMVCQGAVGISSIDWARIGFVAISFLPPLGIHIAHSLADKATKNIAYASYAAATAFSGYFLFATNGITGSVCGGNYVIFQVAPHAVRMFSLYYYLLLLIGVRISLYWAYKASYKSSASALKGLAAGYAVFMIPTIAVYSIDQTTSSGIPSIMCGFAVSLAIALVFWVLPKHMESLADDDMKPQQPRALRPL